MSNSLKNDVNNIISKIDDNNFSLDPDKIVSQQVTDKDEKRVKKREKINTFVDKLTDSSKEKLTEIDISGQIKKTFEDNSVSNMVDDLINKQIDEMVKEKVKSARIAYNDSSINSALSTANAYYKKILDSEKLMTEYKDDYSNALSKSINDSINNRINKINIGGKWGRKILASSKLNSTINNFVTKEISTLINSVASSTAIANVSKDIINTVTRLKNSMTQYLNKAFKDQIAYYKKIKKAVQDKIVQFNKIKDEYIKKAQAYVNKLKNAIADQVKKWEDAAVNEISKFIKVSLGGISI